MPKNKPVAALSFAERLNFLITNRIPRRALTLFMGRFSKSTNPLIYRLSMVIWQLFADDLRLHEAKKSRFSSLHDCFTRELKAGARTVDMTAGVVTSPCDAIIGQFGDLDGLQAIQAKGFPYSIEDLLGDPAAAEEFRGAQFITLRLKSSMYHRFHAPVPGAVDTINYISGDVWNVNPVALKVVERLFCKNERVVMKINTDDGLQVTLVAVAAVLVASVRLHGVPEPLNLHYRGANRLALKRSFAKGEELGYFEHGSTIVMLVPRSHRFCSDVKTGNLIRMGQPLLSRAGPAT